MRTSGIGVCVAALVVCALTLGASGAIVSFDLEIEYTGNPGDFFAGAVTNVRLEEVTVDFDTWESTPVPGGDVWCIDRFDFYQEIAPFP